MAGRHSAPKKARSSRRPLAIVMVVVGALVLAGGGTAWAFGSGALGGDNGREAAASSSSPAPVPAPLLDCKESVQAGDAAVSKALVAYKDWHAHVKAQWDLDKGKITIAKANEIWDRTHKRGSSDMNAFDAQRIVYERQEDACSKVPAEVPKKYDKAVAACKKRAGSIKTTMAAGIDVGNDWMAHVIAERGKDDIPSYNYHVMWVKAVAKAPKALTAFEKAYGSYKKQPKCSLPKSN